MALKWIAIDGRRKLYVRAWQLAAIPGYMLTEGQTAVNRYPALFLKGAVEEEGISIERSTTARRADDDDDDNDEVSILSERAFIEGLFGQQHVECGPTALSAPRGSLLGTNGVPPSPYLVTWPLGRERMRKRND